jgi:hypothetical protein
VPDPLFTVAVIADVVAPSAGTLVGLAETVVTRPADAGFVWIIRVLPLPPFAPVSVAVIVQNAGAAPEVNVAVKTPLEFVLPALETLLIAPQVTTGSDTMPKLIGSLATAAPVKPSVTVTVSAEVLAAFAGTFCGFALSTTVLLTAVEVTVLLAVTPPFASVTETRHAPAVVFGV